MSGLEYGAWGKDGYLAQFEPRSSRHPCWDLINPAWLIFLGYKSICHQHVVCPIYVNASNGSISWIWGFLSVACGVHSAQFAKEGFKFLSLSCLVLAPQNGDHHTLISHFTGVNSPFSTASAAFTSSSPRLPRWHVFSPTLFTGLSI